MFWTRFLAVALGSLLLVPVCASAQDAGPGERVARFVDPQTLAVVRIDLEWLEVPPAAVLVRDLPFDEADRARIEALLELVREAMGSWKQLGASEAYYVVSLADLPRGGGGFLVLPGAKPAPGAEAPESLQQLGGCELVAGALVCAQAETIARLKQQAAGRALPAAAFEAVKDDPLQFVFAPSDEHRRVLREMSPELPAEWGGLTGQILADGVVWAAAGVNLAPQPAVRAVVQSQDAASAGRFQQSLKGGLEALGRNPLARQHLPDIDRSIRAVTPRVEGDQLLLSLSSEDPLVRAVLGQLSVTAGQIQNAAARNQSRDNLHKFGLALHNFHDAYNSFPPTASYDAGGKKLLSWRVYVLPWVDALPLYKEFRLNEPWDSEHNKKLIARMPEVFASPRAEGAAEGKTTYLAPVADSAAFTGAKEGVLFRDFTDGLSNTILLVEVPADRAVIWTKPDDWEVDIEAPNKGLFAEGDDGTYVLIADGSVRFIARTIDLKVLKALFTRNAGDAVGEF
ncbi:MAG TPA: DUF1559 domain-containing protein [Planctomycetaceae bacterium]|nr:DUF1559 domain-containing protein [Planctomycetaceae bacterium]